MAARCASLFPDSELDILYNLCKLGNASSAFSNELEIVNGSGSLGLSTSSQFCLGCEAL